MSSKRLRTGEEFDPTTTFADNFPLSLRLATDLSEGAKWAWLALALNARKSNTDYPTLPTLSRKIGVGRRRARRYIQELIDFGLVEPHSSGRGRKRRYAFKWHSIYERHQPLRSSTTIEAGPLVSVRSIIEEQFPDLSKKLL